MGARPRGERGAGGAAPRSSLACGWAASRPSKLSSRLFRDLDQQRRLAEDQARDGGLHEGRGRDGRQRAHRLWQRWRSAGSGGRTTAARPARHTAASAWLDAAPRDTPLTCTCRRSPSKRSSTCRVSPSAAAGADAGSTPVRPASGGGGRERRLHAWAAGGGELWTGWHRWEEQRRQGHEWPWTAGSSACLPPARRR